MMLRVLVVDSSSRAQRLASLLLVADIRTDVAADGAAALDHLIRDDFDLLLSDVLVPTLDGYELCRVVKSDPQLRHIPVVLLAPPDTGHITKGLAAGADKCIARHDEPEELVALVRSMCIARRTAARQAEQI